MTFAELNLIDRDTLMLVYWTLFAFSNFWIFGLPVQLFIVLLVNFIMQFNVLYNYQISVASDQFNDAQTEAFSIWNWFWESIVWWGWGTAYCTWSMVINSFTPIIGPFLNLMIIVVLYLSMFN